VNEIEIAEQNSFAAWRLLARYAEGGMVDETDEVLFTSIPAPVAYFNSAFVKPPACVSDQLDNVLAYFKAKDVPFTIRFRDDADAAVACEGAGLVLGGSAPYMNGEAAAMPAASDADVRIVDAGSLSDYIAVLAEGFGMPKRLAAAVFTPASLAADDFAMLLAFDGDTPVASSALAVSGDVAGVYNVGTPPQFRQRGFGEVATRAAIAEGVRRGCTRTTLQASAMGFPIYERMGYRTVATWRNFTSPPERT
jgi:hypothetical protein